MIFNASRLSRRTTILGLVGALTVTAAGAATIHRLAVTQSSGSGSLGATTFLQDTSGNSALQAQVAGAAYTGLPYPFGVFGFYNSNSPFALGVVGITGAGYGVAGETMDNNNPSVIAYPGGTGIGLEALSTASSSSPAIYSEAKGTADGIEGVADNTGSYYGVFGSSAGYAGVKGSVNNGGSGYLGLANGSALQAYGYNGGSSHPAIEAHDAGSCFTFCSHRTDLIGGYNYQGTETFIVKNDTFNFSTIALTHGADVEISGDLFVKGGIYEGCNGFPIVNGTTQCGGVASGTAVTVSSQRNPGGTMAAVRTAAGNDVQMFRTSQSSPTVEDFGEAQLVNGRAYVRLDPAFVQTMSIERPYLVFVTAEGATNGVYVSNRTPAGFEIHEAATSRAPLAVDYRIVARPYGDHSQRFVAVAPRTRLAGQPDPSHAAVNGQAPGDRLHRFVPPPVRGLMTRAEFARISHR